MCEHGRRTWCRSRWCSCYMCADAAVGVGLCWWSTCNRRGAVPAAGAACGAGEELLGLRTHNTPPHTHCHVIGLVAASDGLSCVADTAGMLMGTDVAAQHMLLQEWHQCQLKRAGDKIKMDAAATCVAKVIWEGKEEEKKKGRCVLMDTPRAQNMPSAHPPHEPAGQIT